MSDEREASAPRKTVAREYLESIVVAVILALFVRTFAVQAFKIPTGSMETNLLIGDHLLVNKLVYSPSAGPLEAALLGKKPIRRGDVVVFKYPDEPTRDFIKRVVALPGETVQIRNKKVYIDERPLDEPYVHFLNPPHANDEDTFSLILDDGRGENWGPKQVPLGHLLVLGDNRDNSRDGRSWGFLRMDQVKGRALVVYLSYNATREEYQSTGFLTWFRDLVTIPGRLRWERFFHLIR